MKYRAGLKPLALVIAYWIGWILLTRLVVPLIPAVPAFAQPLLYGTIGSLFAWAGAWFLVRANAGTAWPVSSFSVRLQQFFVGLLIAFAVLGTMIIILLLSTSLRFQLAPSGSLVEALIYFIGLVPLALMEEIAFRGVALRKLANVFNPRVSLIICAIAFAVYHISSHYTLMAAFTGPFVWAFLFGLAAFRSRGIALPLGIHFGLNAGQALVGFKPGAGALLVPFFEGGQTRDKIAMVDNMGMFLQLIILIAAWVIIERSLKRGRWETKEYDQVSE